jgi:hypothetical protein
MKIIYISPKYNGLYQYSKLFVHHLEKKKSNNIFHLGFENICFDNEQIEKNVINIVKEIKKIQPDLIHYNYGTYDAEQLIPFFLEQECITTKQILSVHSIQLDLFKKTKNEKYDIKANESVKKMDGYCFFTNYAQNTFAVYDKPYCISYHPATLENTRLKKADAISILEKYGLNKNLTFISLLGYASHWKSSIEFIRLAQECQDIQFVIGGPYWKEKISKENPNINLRELKNLIVIDKELDAIELITFIRGSVGFFPYYCYKSFQGSGMLPNYLYFGKNCIVHDFEPLKEYVKYALVVDFKNFDKIKQSLKICLEQPYIKRDLRFSYRYHVGQIKKLYKEIIDK